MKDKPARKTVKAKVIWLLTKYPNLRDDKVSTCIMLWQREISKLFPDKQTMEVKVEQVFDALLANKLSTAETICRWFRKIQEEEPAMRGLKWAERQGYKQEQAKEYFEITVPKEELAYIKQKETGYLTL